MKQRALPLVLSFLMAQTALGFGIEIDASHTGEKGGFLSKIRRLYPKLGQGIHENITFSAVEETGFVQKLPPELREREIRRVGTTYSDDLLKENLRHGLLFNDDPDGFLFEYSPSNIKGFNPGEWGVKNISGAHWAMVFLEAKKKAARGEKLTYKDGLEAAILPSHFGDLQYLHAMGSATQSRAEIKGQIIAAASHAWRTASGELTYEEQRSRFFEERERRENGEAPKSEGEKFRSRFAVTDLLYHTRDSLLIRYRALGSLIHMVQDSYAKGHTVREGWEAGTNSGRVRYFQDYAGQDGDKHGEHDKHEAGAESWQEIPGAMTAQKRTTDILKFFLNQCSWDGMGPSKENPACPKGGVRTYLDEVVFAMVPGAELKDGDATRSHPDLIKTQKYIDDESELLRE